MRKILLFILCCFMSVFVLSVTAHAYETTTDIQKIIIGGEEYYLITTDSVIQTDSPQNTNDLQTKTETRTSTILDALQNPLWSISVTATFIYDGTMSQCVACSHQTTSYDSHWMTKSSSCSHSGNYATASATVTQTMPLGTHDYYASVTISCTPAGLIY
ncbi:MAG: hypothetical protein K6F51_14500 [Acetatifactor sp.]|nr:hypothetical protein [Acetatifactor sp.]